MASYIERRKFLALLGGAAAWPLVARAQQGERMRRVGLLLGRSEIDPEFQIRTLAFRQELQKLGWIEGRNVRIEIRSGGADGPLATRRNAAELVASSPDVIVAAAGSPGVIAFQQATQSIPVVFVGVVDPGLRASRAQMSGAAGTRGFQRRHAHLTPARSSGQAGGCVLVTLFSPWRPPGSRGGNPRPNRGRYGA